MLLYGCFKLSNSFYLVDMGIFKCSIKLNASLPEFLLQLITKGTNRPLIHHYEIAHHLTKIDI